MKRFDIGARVHEPTYGFGSVIAIEDQFTRVQFDDHGIKKFQTNLSKLEPTGESVAVGKGGTVKRRRKATKAAAPAVVGAAE